MIYYHFENISELKIPEQKLSDWLESVCKSESASLHELNYIFCSDSYLLKINQQYLSHDYFTDIITFDHSNNQDEIMGDIYISIDRVQENAKTYKVAFESELFRVIVHGLLHLLGYDDHGDAVKEMRTKEDSYLSLLSL